MLCFFFFNDTATTEIYTLSLHDALPIWTGAYGGESNCPMEGPVKPVKAVALLSAILVTGCQNPREAERFFDGLFSPRSEEHTSELQSRQYLVCRLLLEKKKKIIK